mmetsp:Transcript_55043/g.103147  ORF Transcript_55043/g.103147 Transcript_55043/m.103147 type:complete len:261 (+) Transcript_55043:520-1302(+)
MRAACSLLHLVTMSRTMRQAVSCLAARTTDPRSSSTMNWHTATGKSLMICRRTKFPLLLALTCHTLPRSSSRTRSRIARSPPDRALCSCQVPTGSMAYRMTCPLSRLTCVMAPKKPLVWVFCACAFLRRRRRSCDLVSGRPCSAVSSSMRGVSGGAVDALEPSAGSGQHGAGSPSGSTLTTAPVGVSGAGRAGVGPVGAMVMSPMVGAMVMGPIAGAMVVWPMGVGRAMDRLGSSMKGSKQRAGPVPESQTTICTHTTGR